MATVVAEMTMSPALIGPQIPFAFAVPGEAAVPWVLRCCMARAIWSGSISFGLLNVPVKLYSAVSKQTIRFRELREGDGSRIKHKRVAEDDGEEVPYEKIVKGYEVTPDQFVVMTRDELEEIDPKKTRAVEIKDFVDLDDIDPIYFEIPTTSARTRAPRRPTRCSRRRCAKSARSRSRASCSATRSTSPRSARWTGSSR